MMKNLLLSMTLFPIFLLGIPHSNNLNEADNTKLLRVEVASNFPICKKTVYYYKKGDDKYRICSDSHGMVVTRPNGSRDAYGGGYTRKEIEQDYRLGKYYDKKEFTKNCSCDK